VNSSFSLPKNVEPQTIYYSADTISFLDNVTGNTKNSGFSLDSFIDDLYSVIELVGINITSNSSLGYTLSIPCLVVPKDTTNLGEDRYNDAILYIKSALTAKLPTTNPPIEKQTAISNINTTTTRRFYTYPTSNGCEPSEFQSLNIKVQYNPKKDKTLTAQLTPNEILNLSNVGNGNNLFLKRTVPLCELDYFEAMDKDSRVALYGSLKEQLRYFSPGFHSMTPEGFNNRLSFLLQCTRQGPSINVGSTKTETNQPSNSAFGRPPVCVLKIGDFYHTKVVMDSVNISYDDNTWDLNADGIGIQPMIATVDLNMKMVGGSSLTRPIEKLQNALSNHFFANTEVFYGIHEKDIEPLEIPPLEIVEWEEDFVLDPPPSPEEPEVTLPGISGFTTINHVLDGEDLLITYKIGQTCEDLKSQVFKTVINVVCSLGGPITEDIILIGKVVGSGVDGATTVYKTLKVADSYTLISLNFIGVKISMNTTYSVRISIKERPEIFSTSETITFPSQTKWDVAGAIYGITAGVPNIPYSYNPFSTYSTVSNVNITPWICKSYWCKSGESPNMDPDLDRGYGLGNCYTGPGD
jgi:hypothetical protein